MVNIFKSKSTLFIILFATSFTIIDFSINTLIASMNMARVDEGGGKLYFSEQSNSMLGKDMNCFIDHLIIMSDYYGSLKYIETADVLFTGSSRSQFGYNNDIISDYFESINTDFFHLGMDYGEGMIFFMNYAKKYNIKDKILIINPDHFFAKYKSPATKLALKGDLYSNIYINSKYFYTYLYSKLFNSFGFSTHWTIYRDRHNGIINLKEFPISTKATQEARYKTQDLTSEEIEQVTPYFIQFLQFANKHNLTLIFAPVPSSETNEYTVSHIKNLGSMFGIDTLKLSDEDLFTFDNSHLNQKSAIIFSKRFQKAFDTLLAGKSVDEYMQSKEKKLYLAPIIIPGVTVTHKNSLLSFKKGWLAAKRNQRWSSGENASLSFNINNAQIFNGDMYLKFVTKNVQFIKIYINGKPVYNGDINFGLPAESLHINFDPSTLINGENIMDFEFATAYAPDNRGPNVLSVGFQSMILL